MNGGILPIVKLIYAVPEAERVIASAAKATLSPHEFTEITSEMSDERVENWVKELITRGHGSPLEHSIYIFEVICSRVCSHQLVRHRHASYSQLSQRYSDKYLRGFIKKTCSLLGLEYKESFEYYVYVLNKLLEARLGFHEMVNLVGEAFMIPPSITAKQNLEYLVHLVESTMRYYKALVNGVPYEDARYLLPQAIKTRVIVSMNARELLEVFLPLRMCTRAQWEIRTIAWSMWKQLLEVHPRIFKYTGPRCVLLENRVKGSPCELNEYLEGKCTFTIERCPEKVPREQVHACLLRAVNGITA